MYFPVVLHSDDAVRFGVTVPDLPGCFSSGDSFDAALTSVKEAIDLHLEGIIEEGDEIPSLKTLAEHRSNPDFSDGIWGVVEVDVSHFYGQTEQIHVALPRYLLAQIDGYSESHGITRSGFLAEAARSVLQK